jgi:hypothetical protein
VRDNPVKGETRSRRPGCSVSFLVKVQLSYKFTGHRVGNGARADASSSGPLRVVRVSTTEVSLEPLGYKSFV